MLLQKLKIFISKKIIVQLKYYAVQKKYSLYRRTNPEDQINVTERYSN